jgi:threonine aldolase
MLGGGMRQVGVLAAAGLIALETGPKRLHIDHANAKFLADQLAEIPGITVDPSKVKTNIVIYGVKQAGWSSADYLQALSKRGVLGVPVDNERVRMVTHLDVNRADIERAVGVIREVIKR